MYTVNRKFFSTSERTLQTKTVCSEDTNTTAKALDDAKTASSLQPKRRNKLADNITTVELGSLHEIKYPTDRWRLSHLLNCPSDINKLFYFLSFVAAIFLFSFALFNLWPTAVS